MKFVKYQALGNDYIVLEPSGADAPPGPDHIRQICHRHFGVGSDGILLRSSETQGCNFALRIFNPDGSEAEKSGNGLRIFARYLWDRGLVGAEPFTILTAGGKTRARVHQGAKSVTVEMGQISFDSALIPVTGPRREVLHETLVLNGQALKYCAATLGNPHCIILDAKVSEENARAWGPLIEKDARFAHRTNVQFMQVLDRAAIQIEIWERGAGYTLASGSSSCAAAAVAHRLGWCDAHIAVHMPGGKIDIDISENWEMTLSGPVAKVCEGSISREIFSPSRDVRAPACC